MPHVATGNRKLGKHIKNVNLLPVVTCVPGVPCAQKGPNGEPMDCYNDYCLRCRPNVVKSWTENTEQAENPVEFFRDLECEWRFSAPKWFRFFSAGDVPSVEFLREMVAFIRKHPETRFLVFTKRYQWWNRYKSLPSHLSLVYSAWPGWKMNNPHGRPVAWMRDVKNLDERIDADAIECPGYCEECLVCWGLAQRGLSVVFDKH